MFIRILSAIIALAIVTTIYYFYRHDGLIGIVLGGALLSQWEYCRLVFPQGRPGIFQIIFILLMFLVVAFTAYQIETLSVLMSVAASLLLVLFLLLGRKEQDIHVLQRSSALIGLGCIYVGVFPATIAALLQHPQGEALFVTLLATVFSGDVFAYFIGKTFGKTKMAPQLSPQKTYAGAVGGLAGSLIAAVTANYFFRIGPFENFFLLGIFAGLFAQVGDFFESLLKRVAEVKDSGRLMPGHGGALDRIDGILFAGPIFYLASRFLL